MPGLERNPGRRRNEAVEVGRDYGRAFEAPNESFLLSIQLLLREAFEAGVGHFSGVGQRGAEALFGERAEAGAEVAVAKDMCARR
jgi:hypothetical protein